MEKVEPEHTAREVVDACADCDVCRHLMDSSCLFFPELYRLIDREMDAKEKITLDENFTAWANNHKLNSNPERLVTDCLSCRLQFNQLLPYAVFHPVEILNESYASFQA